MARSLVPVVSTKWLIDNLTLILKSEDKVKQLLELFSYSGDGILDIQYTPIIRLPNSKCYIMMEVLSRSDLIRNAIFHSRQLGKQYTNSDGENNSLENYTSRIFERNGFKNNQSVK